MTENTGDLTNFRDRVKFRYNVRPDLKNPARKKIPVLRQYGPPEG